MMNINRILSGLFIFLIFHSCTSTKFIEEGEAAYGNKNYQSALSAYEQAINEKDQKGQPVDSSIYYKAGLSARELGQPGKTRKYLELADEAGYASPKLYTILGGMYKSVDNLTLEIEALENYHEKYPEGAKIDSINIRLFETYMESEQWKKANTLWPDIENLAASDTDLLTAYFKLNRELENNDKCDQLAVKILQLDPENLAALEWQAKKYFRKADDLYVKEMKAYEENRTRKQYRQLLKAWDKIWPDFRKSRDYFEKLYKLDPKPEYAKFLGHIYTRMDKEQKADYWYKKAD